MDEDANNFLDSLLASGDLRPWTDYLTMRHAGESHRMAEMLATGKFPGTKGTDRAFMQGRHLDGSQFEGLPDIVGKDYVARAVAAGVNPAGKYYSGPLARYPGDPRAWVDSLHDVRRIAAERGLNVSGAVSITPPEPVGADHAPYRVAPEIVREHVAGLLADRPDLAAKRDEVTAEVATKLAGAWK